MLYYWTQTLIEFGDYPGFEDAEEGWIEFNIVDDEMDKMFEELEQEIELHTLRARAGPPSGEYYMRTNVAPKTGHPESCWGSWTYEEWCPEMGRTSLISQPENNGAFDSFNKGFFKAPIMWGISPKWASSYRDRVLPSDTPPRLVSSVPGIRFSGLKSCGGWMENELDNEGRFVCDGVVTFVCNREPKYTIIDTKYGECVHNYRAFLYPGEKVKILCRDNGYTDPWLNHLKIQCTKVFPKHMWEKGGIVQDGDFSVY